MKTWRERIVEARERGSFSLEDRRVAQTYTTCAVGEQHARHPEIVKLRVWNAEGYLVPVDSTLLALGSGSGFYGAVIANNFTEADRLLDAIEDRVLQLKREAGS